MRISEKTKHHAKVYSKKHKKPAKKTKAHHAKSISKKKLPGAHYPAISGVIIVILLTLVIFMLLKNPSDKGIADEDKVKVEFYVMSQCPYGTQVEDAFYPVLESMGEAIDFHLNYIVQEVAPGQFQSLHGEPEVKGNIVQLCAMKYFPDDYKYMDFIICQNKDMKNVHTNWEACARQNNMDTGKLRACLEGDEGKDLLRVSMQKAIERQAGGSPTIFVNDEPYQGERDALSFQRAVCKHTDYEACDSIPACTADTDCTGESRKIGVCNKPGQQDSFCTYIKPVEVEVIVLYAKDCEGAECDTSRIMSVTQQLFLGTKAREVDVDSTEGKALVEQLGIEVVPVYIFDKNVEQTKTWKERTGLQTSFEKIGDKYRLRDEVSGASYFVTDEARQAYEEAQRAAKQAGYAALGVELDDNKPQIDFFVMSYCPYGNQAEEGIEPVYQLLKDKAEFNPRYVLYSNYRGGGPNYCLDDESRLCSMHGIQELNQNVREACVAKYMGMDSWFEFALAMNDACSSNNADTCWEPVAQGLGLNIEQIKTCEQDEAIALMDADKSAGDLLGVSGSPTIFIDGDSYSGGRTPEGYKQALCAAFDTAPVECNTKLEGEVAQTAPQGNC